MRKVFPKRRSDAQCWIPLHQNVELERNSLFEPTFMIVDGEKILMGCLCCPDKPCISYHHDEISNSILPMDRNVCVKSAIVFNPESEHIQITEDCIGCGFCIFRCPFGVIYHNGSEKARVAMRQEKEFRVI